MQMRAFRGSRTVMSLRLCSRAPWTTSSSAAMGASLYRANMCSHSLCGAYFWGRLAPVKSVAQKAAIATLVAGGIVVAALALWQIRLVLALLFFAFILAAAMRPGIESLARRRVPHGAGLALHYLAFAALVAA